MKPTIAIVLLLAGCLYSGCETPGAAYIKQHPELSQEQRKIFIDKRVDDIKAVAGLTKAQIRVALGEPTQFDTIEGHEAWVYVRSKSSDSGPASQLPNTGQQAAGTELGGTASAQGSSGANAGAIRTTIFFDGDQATRATVAYEQ